jgi:hypothetical protein
VPARRLTGLLAAGLLLIPAMPAGAAGPANVTVRVEGTGDTLVPRTTVRTTTTPVNKDGQAGHTCTGTSVAGALDVATGGAWTATWSNSLKYFVTGIKGESPSGTDFFSLWINGRESQLGVCDAELQEGDDVLFFVARCVAGPPPDYACQNPPVLPLVLTAPAGVTAGEPVTVRVTELAPNGIASPVAGATVSGGGVTAMTGADGAATLRLITDAALRATKEGRARSATEVVRVTAAPGLVPIEPAVVCRTPEGDLCGAPDRRAPVGKILSVREGQRFARGRGPRTLRGTVAADPSGIRLIRLRLTRNDNGRCQTFDGRRERLLALRRCGAARGSWFAVGDRADWSYLLPARLGRGRWVLDLEVTDGAGNRDTMLQRTRSRVVFFVR